MYPYIVLYREAPVMPPDLNPQVFKCMADDAFHAEEQCVEAHPDCKVVWTEVGEDYETVIQNYGLFTNHQIDHTQIEDTKQAEKNTLAVELVLGLGYQWRDGRWRWTPET